MTDAHQLRRPCDGGSRLHPCAHSRVEAYLRIGGKHGVPDPALHLQGADHRVRVRVPGLHLRRVDVDPVRPVRQRLADDGRGRWRDGGAGAVKPGLHGGHLAALEHPDEGVQAVRGRQPAHVAEREAQLVRVQLRLVVGELVEDRQVQLANLLVEAGLVKQFRTAWLLLRGLGLHLCVGNGRECREQVMQIGDQEVQQFWIVKVGDQRQLDGLVERGWRTSKLFRRRSSNSSAISQPSAKTDPTGGGSGTCAGTGETWLLSVLADIKASPRSAATGDRRFDDRGAKSKIIESAPQIVPILAAAYPAVNAFRERAWWSGRSRGARRGPPDGRGDMPGDCVENARRSSPASRRSRGPAMYPATSSSDRARIEVSATGTRPVRTLAA